MGLDMYAWTVPAEVADVEVDLATNDRDTGESLIETAELHYWRKHPNLHGWMQKLYYEKGGTDEEFNCNSVRLTPADLDRLEIDVKERALPGTSGFFFGASDGSELEDDLAFIQKARVEISNGRAVYYSSWW